MSVEFDDQSYTVLWGIAMMLVGGVLLFRSRAVTEFVFSFEPRR